MIISVTGIGSISSNCKNPDELINAAISSSVKTNFINLSIANDTIKVPVCSIDDRDFFLEGFPSFRKLDRTSKLAAYSAQEAWSDSGLDQYDLDMDRVGVIIGTSRGPVGKWEETYRRQLSKMKQLPSLAATGTIASISGSISQLLNASGPSFTISSTCSSSASAISIGASLIEAGTCDVVVVGGVESVINESIINVMRAAGLVGEDSIPEHTCKPFDKRRNGLIVGEGAGFLVLESLNHVDKRRGTPLATVSGCSTGLSQAGKVGVQLSGHKFAHSIEKTIHMSGLNPSDIDYINAHGTGTQLNDLCESNAINLVDGLNDVPVSSIKPITGHCLGASPALEAVLSIKCISNSVVPHTTNLVEQDRNIKLNLIEGEPLKKTVNNVLSTSLGFWGNHASIIFSKIK